MKNGREVSILASLIGDPARANMLTTLMGGQALAASELARAAGITAQTASSHLGQLLAAGLLAVEAQGRHRYYRLSGPEAAAAIEALMVLANAAPKQPSGRTIQFGPKDPAMRHARVCYDHLAGARGVELFKRLCERGIVALTTGQIDVTPYGEIQLAGFGIDIGALRQAKRALCRSCLDWSERVPHLAGALGAELLQRLLATGTVKRVPQTRIIQLTAEGEHRWRQLFTPN